MLKRLPSNLPSSNLLFRKLPKNLNPRQLPSIDRMFESRETAPIRETERRNTCRLDRRIAPFAGADAYRRLNIAHIDLPVAL